MGRGICEGLLNLKTAVPLLQASLQNQNITIQMALVHELPLYLATCAFIFIVSITCKELRLDDKYMNKELNDLAAFYFKALNGGEIIDT